MWHSINLCVQWNVELKTTFDSLHCPSLPLVAMLPPATNFDYSGLVNTEWFWVVPAYVLTTTNIYLICTCFQHKVHFPPGSVFLHGYWSWYLINRDLQISNSEFSLLDLVSVSRKMSNEDVSLETNHPTYPCLIDRAPPFSILGISLLDLDLVSVKFFKWRGDNVFTDVTVPPLYKMADAEDTSPLHYHHNCLSTSHTCLPAPLITSW